MCLLQASVVFLLEACLAEEHNAAMPFDGDQVLNLKDKSAMVAFVDVVLAGMGLVVQAVLLRLEWGLSPPLV